MTILLHDNQNETHKICNTSIKWYKDRFSLLVENSENINVEENKLIVNDGDSNCISEINTILGKYNIFSISKYEVPKIYNIEYPFYFKIRRTSIKTDKEFSSLQKDLYKLTCIQILKERVLCP